MYNDLFDFRSSNKEMAALILVVLIVLVVCFGAGYLLGVERTQDLYDNGGGTGNVREQLGTAAVHQRELTEGISRAETGAVRIEAGVVAVSESVEKSTAAVSDAAGIIDECQQILGRVRNRGQAHPVKD